MQLPASSEFATGKELFKVTVAHIVLEGSLLGIYLRTNSLVIFNFSHSH